MSSFEDRIKDALNAEAGTAVPTPAKWDAMVSGSSAVRRSSRTQRFVVAGLSAAAVAVVVAGFLFLGGNETERKPITSPPVSTVEPGIEGAPFIVGITKTGEIEVRDSSNGHVKRLGAVDLEYGWPRLAASPDGRYVYYDDVDPSGECGGRSITRIHVDDGSINGQFFANASQPALSPDGRRMAYVTRSTPCGVNDTLVVRTIEGTGEWHWTTGTDESVVEPSWATHGKTLSAVLVIGDSQRLVEVNTDGAQETASFATGREIPIPASTRPFGYLTNDLHLGLASPEDTTYVIGFDDAGKIISRPGMIAGVADNLSAVASPDGKYYVLVLRGTPGGPVSAGDADTQYSLSIVRGGEQTRQVADDLVSVAWLDRLPAGSAPVPAPESTIVAASADGPIVVLDPNGTVLRTIAERPAQPSGRNEEIALSADGEWVFYERAAADADRGCEASAFEAGEIMRVHRSGGTPEPVVTGRFPALSPDGRSLAFVSYARCDQPGRLAVIAAHNGEDAQLWPAPNSSVRGPLTWNSDGTAVHVQLFRTELFRAWNWVDTTKSGTIADPGYFGRADELVRGGRGASGVMKLKRRTSEPDEYEVTTNAVTDRNYSDVSIGRVSFDGDPLLAWTADAARERCLFIVGPEPTTLYTRTCRGNDAPKLLSTGYTAAAW